MPCSFPNTAARQSRSLTGFPHQLLFEVVSAIFNGREHQSIFHKPRLVVLNDSGDFPTCEISVNMPQITTYSTSLNVCVNMQARGFVKTPYSPARSRLCRWRFPKAWMFALCSLRCLSWFLNKSGHSVDQGKSTGRLTCPPNIEPLTV